MLEVRTHRLGSTITLCLALGFTACSGDGDTPDTGVVDTGGNVDTGMVDTGRADTGRADTGVIDTGVDAGPFVCDFAGTVDVDGTNVTVAEATSYATSENNTDGVLSCRRAPPPQFLTDYCLTECADFLGYVPTQDEVDAIEVAVFREVDVDQNLVDPTYDRTNGLDRTPGSRTGIGAAFIASTECSSGFQIEIGFTAGNGAGAESFSSETQYIIRTRSVTATTAWADAYHYGFVRRNDEVPQVSQCGIDENRIPNNNFVFPVAHQNLIQDAVTTSGAVVPGGADLTDGLGSGYLVIESRDCSAGGGVRIDSSTGGSSPAPIELIYPDADYYFAANNTATSGNGLVVGVGYAEMTATSSLALPVTAAIGAWDDEECTDALFGRVIEVHPDSISMIRMMRDNFLYDD